MKKLLALLLCLVLVIGMVACATTEAPADQPAADAPAADTPAADAPAADEHAADEPAEETPAERPVVKVAYCPDPSCTDMDDNDMTRYFEEVIGADIEWVELPINIDDAVTKINLWAADPNADMPDVIMGGVFDNTDKDWGDVGLLINFNDYLDQMPNWSALGEEMLTQVNNEIGTPDGALYSLPQINGNYWNMGFFRWRMNTAWLDALDLEVPTTTEELKEVLIAFRDGDPNGNGLQDEIPLTGLSENNSYGNNTLHTLMNCFIYFDSFIRNTGLSLDAETGTQVIAPYATEEWQEGLRYIKDLWDEGLISSSYFTHTYETLQTEVNSEVDIVGCLTSGSNGLWSDRGSGNNQNWNNTTMVPMVVGSESGFGYSIHNPNRCWKFLGVLAGGNVELGLKFCDAMYTMDAALWANCGRYGIDWTDDPEVLANASNGLIEAGAASKDELVAVIISPVGEGLWDNPNNVHWWTNDPYCYPIHDNAVIGSTDPASWDMYKGMNMAYNRNLYPNEIPTLNYTTEEYDAASEAMVLIPDYVRESFAAFVTGTMDIDADWDTYIDTLNSMGLETLIEVSQAAFERT